MAVTEPFEATDANGITVRGTVDVGREREGDFFNPASPNYNQPRFANYQFEYFNTREACKIDPKALEDAMQDALRKALIRFGIQGPDNGTIANDVRSSVRATREQCTENADKYVSNETFSATDWETGKPVGHVTARAYAAVPTPDGGVRNVVARENTWPTDDVTPFNMFGRDADLAAAGSAGEAVRSNAPASNGRFPMLPIGYEGQPGQQFVPMNPQATSYGVPTTGLLRQTGDLAVPRLPSAEEMVTLANAEVESERPARYLSRRIAGRVNTPAGGLGTAPFDFDSAASPFVPSDDIFASGGVVSPDERFGGWLQRHSSGLEPAQPTTLPGLVSGKPMDYLLPPSVFGFPQTPARDDEDWLLQLLAPRRGR